VCFELGFLVFVMQHLYSSRRLPGSDIEPFVAPPPGGLGCPVTKVLVDFFATDAVTYQPSLMIRPYMIDLVALPPVNKEVCINFC